MLLESCREGFRKAVEKVSFGGEGGRTCFADGQVSHHMFFPCPGLDGLEASLEREAGGNLCSWLPVFDRMGAGDVGEDGKIYVLSLKWS